MRGRLLAATTLMLMLGAGPALAQTAGPQAVTAQAAPSDPIRLAGAQRVAARLMPVGVYRTMMKSVFDQLSDSMMAQMLDMPMRNFTALAGISADEAAKVGPGTMRQIMTVMDPAFEQRSQIMMRVMMGEMTELLVELEPTYREGLADGLSARFTAAQLDELDRFFATPTGSAYAAESLLLYSSPEMMQRMQGLMPRIMQAMPGIIAKVGTATAHLPKMRDAKDLTPAERQKLAALIAPAGGADK